MAYLGARMGSRVVLDRHKVIASLLEGFEADGDLTFTDTGQQIVEQVARKRIEIRGSGLMPDIGAVGLDSWGMGTLVDALVTTGFGTYDEVSKSGASILPVRQAVALTGTIKTTEFKLVDGMLRMRRRR